jgi:hypothetical protein
MDLPTLRIRLTPLVLVPVLAACSASTLDADGVEAQILKALQDEGSPVTEVACPESVDVATGARFTCTGTTPDGTWTIEVTQVDDQGNLTFEVTGTA